MTAMEGLTLLEAVDHCEIVAMEVLVDFEIGYFDCLVINLLQLAYSTEKIVAELDVAEN